MNKRKIRRQQRAFDRFSIKQDRAATDPGYAIRKQVELNSLRKSLHI